MPARHRPSADGRPLPPEQPGQVHPYAAEMADLMVEMNALSPYVPYTVMDETIPPTGDVVARC